MKTRSIALGLLVLFLALAWQWALQRVPQASGAATTDRAWVLIDFRTAPARAPAEIARLQRVARNGWRPGRVPPGSRRPSRNTRIAQIYWVERLKDPDGKLRPTSGLKWEAIALVDATSVNDLRNVEAFIHENFSHVESFRIHR